MAVKILIHLHFKPEALEAFKSTITESLKLTASFPGFQDIRIISREDDPCRVMFFETWDSAEDYDNYFKWRTGRGEIAALKDALTEPLKREVWPETIIEQLEPLPPQ